MAMAKREIKGIRVPAPAKADEKKATKEKKSSGMQLSSTVPYYLWEPITDPVRLKKYEDARAVESFKKTNIYRVAQVFCQMKKYTKAIDCYTSLPRSVPLPNSSTNKDMVHYYTLYIERKVVHGFALHALGQYSEALGCFVHLQDFETLKKRRILGTGLYDTLGKSPAEQFLIGRRNQLRLSFIQSYFNHGIVLYALERYAEALASFTEVLNFTPEITTPRQGGLYRHVPKDVDVWNNMAAAFYKLGNHAEALDYLDKILEKEPGHLNALANKEIVLDVLSKKSVMTSASSPEALSPSGVPLSASSPSQLPAPAPSAAPLPMPPSPSKAVDTVVKQEEPVERKGQAVSPVSATITYTDIVLGRKLGQGGFGTVYQGLWRHTDVAVKQLLAASLTPAAIEEFKRESAIMARLRSPYIVQFYGCCVSPQYSIVMEYMPKGSLFDVLHNEKPLSWEIRYQIINDMARGLAFLHAEHILHRDLKSLNVLLDEHHRAKLTDFGLSRVKNETRSTSTRGGMVGTLAWMAPELAEDEAKYTPQADIYSFGITLWEIAARQLPFADIPNTLLIPLRAGMGKRDKIPDSCPKKLASLIRFCWDTNPAKRPSIDQVATYWRSPEEEFVPAASSRASASSSPS